MKRPVCNELLGTLLHIPFAFFGGCIISCAIILLVNAFLSAAHSHLHGVGGIYSPIFWVPGLFVGATVNRFARHRWAYLAPATMAIVILIWIMASDVSFFHHSEYFFNRANGHLWRYELQNLFSTVPPSAEDGGLEQLFVTFPFLNCVAYAVGASIGWISGERGSAQITLSTP